MSDPDVALLPGASSPMAGGRSGSVPGSTSRDDTQAFLTHGPIWGVAARVCSLVDQLTVVYGRPGGTQRKVRLRGGVGAVQPVHRAFAWGLYYTAPPGTAFPILPCTH